MGGGDLQHVKSLQDGSQRVAQGVVQRSATFHHALCVDGGTNLGGLPPLPPGRHRRAQQRTHALLDCYGLRIFRPSI